MPDHSMHVSIFLMINKRLLEEHAIVDGVRSYAAVHQLPWQVTPLGSSSNWTQVLLERALPQGVFIGPRRPDVIRIPQKSLAVDYPWVDWIAERYSARFPAAPERATDAAVCFDAAAVGRVAFEYLRRAGARSMAIQRDQIEPNQRTRRARLAAFRASVEAAGMQVHVLCEEGLDQPGYFQRLRQLGRTLPKPIGVFCYHDHVADALIEDLTHIGIAVPREFMVLGGNGSAAAANAGIPISSVRLPYRALGRAAAGLAHQLLGGVEPDPALVSIAPMAVDERASTAAGPRSKDPLIRRAMRRIARKDRPLPGVAELAQHCGCSRQVLFSHFRRELGCSPRQWLEERAMQRATRLLFETDRDLATIASLCGYAYDNNLTRKFKKRFGITPGAYRSMER